MDRTFKNLSSYESIPRPGRLPEIGLVTFSYIQNLHKQYQQNSKELTDQVKNALFEYAQHKHYMRQRNRNLGNQWKKTVQMLDEMEVFD